jgi:choline-sulfatase
MIRVSFTHPSGSQSTKQPKRKQVSNRHPVPHPSPRSSCVFLIAGIVVICSFTLLANTSRAASPEKPNVLFIAIDDLNDWVGFLDGHLEAVTPHMDALARKGCKFTNAHCDVPVCSPSRVSVMSGVTATKHGSYELGPKYEQLPALNNVPTMQRYFKDNGYYTLAGGKILHHGFSGRLAGDIDRSLGRNRSPKPSQPLNRPASWSRAWDWGKYPENDTEMADHQLAKNAAKALHEDFEKPFFMSVGFFRPHVPLYVPPKWFDLYDANAFMLPKNPKSDLDDLPENFLGINHYAAAPTHAEVVKHKKQRSLTHAYLASVSFVDHCVGIVIEALKSSPHADNTLIVLWSDHGFHLGEKQHWAKRTLWEESTQVPLLFTGPGIDAGTSCNEPASLIDIYPTLVELCKLPKNSHLDGVSLVPQLRDSSTPRDHPAITSSYAGNHSIRNRDWRLIVYDDGAEELYDHQNDPDEFHNLAGQSKYKVIRDELARWLPQESVPEFKAKSERARASGRKQPTPP